LVVAAVAVVGILSPALPVHAAATPGCYTRDPATGLVAASGCPSSLSPDPSKCYLATLLHPGVSAFTATDCASITVNDTTPSTPSSIGGKKAEEVNPFIVTPVSDCDHCITKDIQQLIDVVAIGVGVVVVAMIIIAGIQYTASRDNPQAVQAAKSKIVNAIIALIAFTFIYTFLQWIVPGGIF
jgi:hypothetical protein